PLYDKAWCNKGIALDNLDKHVEAIECFDEAIKINPLYDRAWNYKGAALVELGQLDEAMECYGKGLRINKKKFRLSF
ncbi:MAG: tetratricopeptide repeat protein, partial [Nitrososphaeraceae archaeon]